jgi:hypothetical protein
MVSPGEASVLGRRIRKRYARNLMSASAGGRDVRPPFILDVSGNGRAQGRGASFNRLFRALTAFDTGPGFRLVDEPAQLFQQDAGGCALALERLDPVEPGQHCAGLVHVAEGTE